MEHIFFSVWSLSFKAETRSMGMWACETESSVIGQELCDLMFLSAYFPLVDNMFVLDISFFILPVCHLLCEYSHLIFRVPFFKVFIIIRLFRHRRCLFFYTRVYFWWCTQSCNNHDVFASCNDHSVNSWCLMIIFFLKYNQLLISLLVKIILCLWSSNYTTMTSLLNLQ